MVGVDVGYDSHQYEWLAPKKCYIININNYVYYKGTFYVIFLCTVLRLFVVQGAVYPVFYILHHVYLYMCCSTVARMAPPIVLGLAYGLRLNFPSTWQRILNVLAGRSQGRTV